ncbi:hypothetical protein D9M69_699150 [compost metagenome]
MLAEVNRLNRLTDCGPYTLWRVTNWVIGAIWPVEVLTKILFRSDSSRRFSGRAWIITRYCLPNRTKSAA